MQPFSEIESQVETGGCREGEEERFSQLQASSTVPPVHVSECVHAACACHVILKAAGEEARGGTETPRR